MSNKLTIDRNYVQTWVNRNADNEYKIERWQKDGIPAVSVQDVLDTAHKRLPGNPYQNATDVRYLFEVLGLSAKDKLAGQPFDELCSRLQQALDGSPDVVEQGYREKAIPQLLAALCLTAGAQKAVKDAAEVFSDLQAPKSGATEDLSTGALSAFEKLDERAVAKKILAEFPRALGKLAQDYPGFEPSVREVLAVMKRATEKMNGMDLGASLSEAAAWSPKEGHFAAVCSFGDDLRPDLCLRVLKRDSRVLYQLVSNQGGAFGIKPGEYLDIALELVTSPVPQGRVQRSPLNMMGVAPVDVLIDVRNSSGAAPTQADMQTTSSGDAFARSAKA